MLKSSTKYNDIVKEELEDFKILSLSKKIHDTIANVLRFGNYISLYLLPPDRVALYSRTYEK